MAPGSNQGDGIADSVFCLHRSESVEIKAYI